MYPKKTKKNKQNLAHSTTFCYTFYYSYNLLFSNKIYLIQFSYHGSAPLWAIEPIYLMLQLWPFPLPFLDLIQQLNVPHHLVHLSILSWSNRPILEGLRIAKTNGNFKIKYLQNFSFELHVVLEREVDKAPNNFVIDRERSEIVSQMSEMPKDPKFSSKTTGD